MMSNQQMAMVGIPNAGGPVGGAPMVNAGSRSGIALSQLTSLNTYIYDYFLRQGFHDAARAILKAHRTADNKMPLQLSDASPSGRDVNGVDGADSKEDVKRPLDLPEPGNNISSAESCFLEDWWCQFWDLHAGARGNAQNPAVSQYITTNQNQQLMRQRRQNELVSSNTGAMMYNRMPNGVGNVDMRQAAMMKNSTFNPAMLQAAQLNPELRRQMMQQRGQNPGMGEQRSQSPNGNGDAPSPKRQRMEGAFNGQVMVPAGRGQGMPGQPNMGAANGMMLQNGLPESFPGATMPQLKMGDGASPMPPGSNAGDGGNHALQDYQMQLMLLEQQNKKRLLMARQEQDSMVPGQQAQMAQFVGGTGMSPTNSRQGPSPSPADQMKRGTPQLGQKGLPPGSSPAAIEGMQGNRGSPAPGFDPNMPPNMQGHFFQGGMNPQMAAAMGRPPSSHPGGFQPPPGMTPQQFEMMRQQHAARGQPMPGMMPGQMIGQQPGQPGQPAQPIGTPRQPQGNMPPPPAPATQNEQKTNPSSPNQGGPAAPPTPSQQKSSLPKGNKKEKAAPNKKANAKKNQQAAAATPASEAEPPTPTTANAPNAGAAVPGPQNPTPQGSSMDGSGQFDTGLDNMSLELANFESGDVLENFDFDTFLHNTDDTTFSDFDMGFDNNGLLADG